MTISCSGEELILDKERAIYWPAKRMLIISDIHIGKSAHFRRSGIPVPATIGQKDLSRITKLAEVYGVDNLVITGDMFHNNMNSDVEDFRSWRAQHSQLEIHLIKGNHDGLKMEDYVGLGIQIHQKELLQFPFRFIHDKPETNDEYFNITGHIHPGVTIHGKARQQLRLPCFYFSHTCAVLPAFSAFTGLSNIKASEGDTFYAITPTKVVMV
ncbi:ligase-associated DNA damage response endonuclease PdeM [Pedobacter sp. SAFR-022]|uniref:ligase-associated DNA damage response endonuclease PdeM n=1 Tax=Pedobacter sp. SAFR-022 TaxID=3436861 RepID=UPI003F818D4C